MEGKEEKVGLSPEQFLLAINSAVQQAMLKNNQLVQALSAEICRLKTENAELKKALPKE